MVSCITNLQRIGVLFKLHGLSSTKAWNLLRAENGKFLFQFDYPCCPMLHRSELSSNVHQNQCVDKSEVHDQSKPRKDEQQFVHMLDSTLTATERTICCILETYQREDGVEVPRTLQPYMGGIDFLPFVQNLYFFFSPLIALFSLGKVRISSQLASKLIMPLFAFFSLVKLEFPVSQRIDYHPRVVKPCFDRGRQQRSRSIPFPAIAVLSSTSTTCFLGTERAFKGGRWPSHRQPLRNLMSQ